MEADEFPPDKFYPKDLINEKNIYADSHDLKL